MTGAGGSLFAPRSSLLDGRAGRAELALRLLRFWAVVATNNSLRLFVSLAFLFAAAIPAQGSVARAVSFEEKVAGADAIVLGRCTATRSEWDPSRRWILTYSTFEVEKAYKGTAVPQITVVTPGGTVGSLHQETVGIPHFQTGDHSVVFVKRGPAGPTVLYFDQGVYRVGPDTRGDLIVQPVASSLVLVDRQSGRVSGGETALPLRLFEQQVKQAMDRAERARLQRYGVTQAEKRAEKPPAVRVVGFVRAYWLLLGLLAIAIALTTYLLIRGR